MKNGPFPGQRLNWATEQKTLAIPGKRPACGQQESRGNIIVSVSCGPCLGHGGMSTIHSDSSSSFRPCIHASEQFGAGGENESHQKTCPCPLSFFHFFSFSLSSFLRSLHPFNPLTSRSTMLTSLHQMVSSLVHRRREAVNDVVATQPAQEVAAAVTTSKNWDYTIVFKGAKVRDLSSE